jgi:DNA gyrase subunit A
MRGGREAIIVHEIPYQVNKSLMIEKMAELVRDKRIEGISDIRDESDRHGLLVVIELKRDAVRDVVLQQLYRCGPLQAACACIFVARHGGKPELMSIRDMLVAFVQFREQVVTRRTKFLLNKARDRAHVLVGLAVAVANIDEVIALIRSAPDPGTARERLMDRDWPARDVEPLIRLIDDPRHQISEDGTFRLSDEQARAILALTLSRLTALGRDEIGEELDGLGKEISDYLDILRSRERVLQIVRDELNAIKNEFSTPRLTTIDEAAGDFEDEDLIAREDMVVTVTHGGYIKRVPLTAYRAQKRGGKGRSGMSTRDEDFVTRLFVANTHTPVLFFSSLGQVYKLKVWRLPIAEPQGRGRALVNMLPFDEGEHITSILPLPEDEADWKKLDIMFATRTGNVRRNSLADFVEVNKNGKIAMNLDEGDEIVGVETCSADNDVLLTTSLGQAIRFQVDEVRVFKGRDSTGVRGISLAEGDKVISMTVIRHFEATSEERAAYLKTSRAVRGEADAEEGVPEDGEDVTVAGELPQERYVAMSAAEQFILTISQNGYGKRTSSHEYRTTGRGGKGIVAMAVNDRNGPLVGSFPVENDDEIMLITDGGQTIRLPVGGDKPIRIAGRSSQGVIVFRTAEGEKVVSVERISEPGGDESEDGEGGEATEEEGLASDRPSCSG